MDSNAVPYNFLPTFFLVCGTSPATARQRARLWLKRLTSVLVFMSLQDSLSLGRQILQLNKRVATISAAGREGAILNTELQQNKARAISAEL